MTTCVIRDKNKIQWEKGTSLKGKLWGFPKKEDKTDKAMCESI